MNGQQSPLKHSSSSLPPSCLYCLVEEVFLFPALESTLSSFSLPGGSVTVLSSVICMCPSISFFFKVLNPEYKETWVMFLAAPPQFCDLSGPQFLY